MIKAFCCLKHLLHNHDLTSGPLWVSERCPEFLSHLKHTTGDCTCRTCFHSNTIKWGVELTQLAAWMKWGSVREQESTDWNVVTHSVCSISTDNLWSSITVTIRSPLFTPPGAQGHFCSATNSWKSPGCATLLLFEHYRWHCALRTSDRLP